MTMRLDEDCVSLADVAERRASATAFLSTTLRKRRPGAVERPSRKSRPLVERGDRVFREPGEQHYLPWKMLVVKFAEVCGHFEDFASPPDSAPSVVIPDFNCIFVRKGSLTPPGRSVRPIDPANSVSPTNR